MKYRVGIAGLGIGARHWRDWKLLGDEFEVAMVCDPDDARRIHRCEREGVAGTPDFSEMLDAGLDIIDIATPPHLHFDMASRALESGHHVVCEKPLVNSLAEADELIRLASETGKRFMPISQYRFGEGIQRLKYLVDLGLVGKPYVASVETHWLRGADYYEAPWRGRWETERGGVLLCHALHIHDLLCFVMGPVEKVYAQVATRVNPVETEDCAVASLTMTSGALVSSSSTLGSREQISRLRFSFEHLLAESNHEPYDPGRDPWNMITSGTGIDADIADALRAFTPLPPGFRGQFLNLFDHLESGSPLLVTLEDARRSLELVTAMYASARRGEVERLPIEPTHSLYTDWRP